MTLGDHLPNIYKRWVDPALLAMKAEEPLSTCVSCPMCQLKSGEAFLNSTKCCTYYPFVPNFLIGGILSEGQEGATRIKALLRRRQWVLPIGLVAPPSYQERYLAKPADAFGRDPDFICPFFVSQTGGCSIWKWRDSQCSTYFCKPDPNGIGDDLWSSVRECFYSIELQVSQDLMLEKGYTVQEIENCLKWVKALGRNTRADCEYDMGSVLWSQMWLHHHDEIELFFLECYKIAVNNSLQYQRLFQESTERLCHLLKAKSPV